MLQAPTSLVEAIYSENPRMSYFALADGIISHVLFCVLDWNVATFSGQAPAPASASQVHSGKVEVAHVQSLEIDCVQPRMNLIELLPVKPGHHQPNGLKEKKEIRKSKSTRLCLILSWTVGLVLST